jgi:transketolase
MIFNKEKEDFRNDYKVINNMRGLAIDMIDNAKSGHPGICLGAATILYTLYSRHLSFNREDVKWYNRDRFILSAGHGAPLFYSMLHMLGILSLDDLKSLRTLDSITPGHPEITTPMVDMSTGPLGQGIASSVGMAIAERYLNATYNKNLINHYTYVLCGDGDLEEGISYEAMALASKLKLSKLIILYDSNDVTLDGKLENSSTEDVITRFKALNFDIYVVDGDSVKEIDSAITRARDTNMPSIIICKTVIGKYSKDAGTNTVHGKPLEKEDIANIKEAMGILNSPFTVSSDAIEYFKNLIDFSAGENEQAGIRKKPAPDTIFEVLKKFNLNTEEAIYVGDSEVDIQTAQNCNMECVSVLWGFKTYDFLKENGAKNIIKTPNEIFKYL